MATTSPTTYIGRIQELVAQCVLLWPIIEVCARETGYEGGGCRRDTWWRQDVPETHLKATLEEILLESRGRKWGDRTAQ